MGKKKKKEGAVKKGGNLKKKKEKKTVNKRKKEKEIKRDLGGGTGRGVKGQLRELWGTSNGLSGTRQGGKETGNQGSLFGSAGDRRTEGVTEKKTQRDGNEPCRD